MQKGSLSFDANRTKRKTWWVTLYMPVYSTNEAMSVATPVRSRRRATTNLGPMNLSLMEAILLNRSLKLFAHQMWVAFWWFRLNTFTVYSHRLLQFYWTLGIKAKCNTSTGRHYRLFPISQVRAAMAFTLALNREFGEQSDVSPCISSFRLKGLKI